MEIENTSYPSVEIDTTCPYCGKQMAGTVSVGNKAPHPGMMSMCASCGEVGKLDENMKIQPFDTSTLEPDHIKFINYLRAKLLMGRILEALLEPEDGS